MHQYVKSIKEIFLNNVNPEKAYGAEKYLRFQFKFAGIQTPARKELITEFLRINGYPDVSEFKEIILELWNDEYRDMQYFAMNLIDRYIKNADKNFIDFLEYLITNKSWWDSVDFLAPTLVRKHFEKYPELIPFYTEKWINSDNIWLNRSAILFQLNKKKETDTELLFRMILKRKDSKEFFVQKAMGWSLRQYARTNSNLVLDFVNKNPDLPPLTKREALKHFKM
jgi:3-methyladenine DNA glycosylase AlkD